MPCLQQALSPAVPFPWRRPRDNPRMVEELTCARLRGHGARSPTSSMTRVFRVRKLGAPGFPRGVGKWWSSSSSQSVFLLLRRGPWVSVLFDALTCTLSQPELGGEESGPHWCGHALINKSARRHMLLTMALSQSTLDLWGRPHRVTCTEQELDWETGFLKSKASESYNSLSPASSLPVCK